MAIVVSAMSKVTDLLLDSLRKAEAGDEADLDATSNALRSAISKPARALLSGDRSGRRAPQVDELIAEFARIANGMMMLGERPPRSVDRGHRDRRAPVSAHLMAAYLESQGVRAQAVNAAEVIATDAVFGNATPLMDRDARTCGERAAAPARPGRAAGRHGIQRIDAGRPPDHAGPRRIGFLGIHPGRRAGRRRSCGSGPTSTAS